MRDYAKRTSRPIKQNNSDGKGILVFLILCTVLFVGYVIYHFAHQKSLPAKKKLPISTHTSAPLKVKTKPISLKHEVIKKPVKIAKKEIKHTKEIVKKPIALNPADIQPTYDFYKLLPAMTVTIPKKDKPLPTHTSHAVSAKTTASHSGNYVLQMASVQTSQQATQIATTLKTAGYLAFVQSYQAPDHSTWYRVMIGPFNTLKTAEAQQNKLYAHQMDALLLKI
jgi:cell division protein FtsN